MDTNGNQKTKKVVYARELAAKRDELTIKLKDLDPASDEFKACRSAIEDINRILNERTNTRSNVLKIGGMLFLTALGLGFAHKDDIGTTIPGKYVSKLVDGLLNRVSR